MARTPSKMITLGSRMPAFRLPDALGVICDSDAIGNKPVLVMFICNHCPYVKHVASELARLADAFLAMGIFVVAINSNDSDQYPEDGPAYMLKDAELYSYRFPYLIDRDQSVANAFDAACTPDFFLYDSHGDLYYRGELDGSRPGNGIAVDGSSLRDAAVQLLSGKAFSGEQRASLGCNIKWTKTP